MKILFLMFITVLVSSCGRVIENAPPYFYEDGWRRNNQTYANGKKTSNDSLIGIPYTKIQSEVISFPVKCWTSEIGRNYCRGGRILSLDLSKFLSYDYYQVLSCYKEGNACYAEIRFDNTKAEPAYFDYQAY